MGVPDAYVLAVMLLVNSVGLLMLASTQLIGATMSRTLDLDARRKAALAETEPLIVTMGGEKFTLPAELPLVFAYHLTNMDLYKAARALVGDDDAERFLEANPSEKDFEQIIEAYGVELGESSASTPSSGNTGKRSKPTSAGSTKRS
jgi:hypothetical protein